VVAFQDVTTGGSAGSASVSTATSVPAVAGQLYVAAIATKNYRGTTAVSGLGLVWRELVDQCAGRAQTGISLWWALGTPGASGPVTATLASAANNAALAVTRYSGASPSDPVGSGLGVNTNGPSGACSGGTDTDAYSFSLDTLRPNAWVHSAAAIRQRAHTPGPGYTERVELVQGTGGSAAGLAAMNRLFASPGLAGVQGSIDSEVDWAAAAVEVRP
jgi:hypothetical protein